MGGDAVNPVARRQDARLKGALLSKNTEFTLNGCRVRLHEIGKALLSSNALHLLVTGQDGVVSHPRERSLPLVNLSGRQYKNVVKAARLQAVSLLSALLDDRLPSTEDGQWFFQHTVELNSGKSAGSKAINVTRKHLAGGDAVHAHPTLTPAVFAELARSPLPIRTWSAHMAFMKVPIRAVRVQEFWKAVRDVLPITLHEDGASLLPSFVNALLVESNLPALQSTKEDSHWSCLRRLMALRALALPLVRRASIVAHTSMLVNAGHGSSTVPAQALLAGLTLGKENRETAKTLLQGVADHFARSSVVRAADEERGLHSIRKLDDKYDFVEGVQADGCGLASISGVAGPETFSRKADSPSAGMFCGASAEEDRQARLNGRLCEAPLLTVDRHVQLAKDWQETEQPKLAALKKDKDKSGQKSEAKRLALLRTKGVKLPPLFHETKMISLAVSLWADPDVHTRSSLVFVFLVFVWQLLSKKATNNQQDHTAEMVRILKQYGYVLTFENGVPIHRTDASWRVLLSQSSCRIKLLDLLHDDGAMESLLTSGALAQPVKQESARTSTVAIKSSGGEQTVLPVIENLLKLCRDSFQTNHSYQQWCQLWRRLFYIILPAVSNCDVLSPVETGHLIDRTENHIKLFLTALENECPDSVRRAWYFHELSEWPRLSRRLLASLSRSRVVIRPGHFSQSLPEKINGPARRVLTMLTSGGGGMYNASGASIACAQTLQRFAAARVAELVVGRRPGTEQDVVELINSWHADVADGDGDDDEDSDDDDDDQRRIPLLPGDLDALTTRIKEMWGNVPPSEKTKIEEARAALGGSVKTRVTNKSVDDMLNSASQQWRDETGLSTPRGRQAMAGFEQKIRSQSVPIGRKPRKPGTRRSMMRVGDSQELLDRALQRFDLASTLSADTYMEELEEKNREAAEKKEKARQDAEAKRKQEAAKKKQEADKHKKHNAEMMKQLQDARAVEADKKRKAALESAKEKELKKQNDHQKRGKQADASRSSVARAQARADSSDPKENPSNKKHRSRK